MVKIVGFRAGSIKFHSLPTEKVYTGNANFAFGLAFVPPSLLTSVTMPPSSTGWITTVPFSSKYNQCNHLQYEGILTGNCTSEGWHRFYDGGGYPIDVQNVWDGKSSVHESVSMVNQYLGPVSHDLDIFPDPLFPECMIVAFWSDRQSGVEQAYFDFNWERYRLDGDQLTLVTGMWCQGSYDGKTHNIIMPASVARPEEAYNLGIHDRRSRDFTTPGSYTYGSFRWNWKCAKSDPPLDVNLPVLRFRDEPWQHAVERAGFDWSIPDAVKAKMALVAYQGTQAFSGNGIAYLRDMKNLREMLNAFLTINPSSFLKGVKGLSSSYLAWHYGAKLTCLDTISLINGIQRVAWQREKGLVQASSASTAWEGPGGVPYKGHYSCFIPNSPLVFKDLRRILHDFDLLPNLGNGWDMIPYSFVVDWVANIGDVLDSIDVLTSYQKLGIEYCESSISAILPIKTKWGNLSRSFFSRRYFKRPWTPEIVDVSFSNPFSHSVEGSALVIQKLH